jgi:hypothetical protein
MTFRINLASMNGFTRSTIGTTVGDVFDAASMAQRASITGGPAARLNNELSAALGSGNTFQGLMDAATRGATLGAFRLGMNSLMVMNGSLQIRITVRQEHWFSDTDRESFREIYAPHQKRFFLDDYIEVVVPMMREMDLDGGLVHCAVATLLGAYAGARPEERQHRLNLSITDR